METGGFLGELECLGSYQLSPIWKMTYKSLAAKYRLLNVKEPQVKGKRWLVLEPNMIEVVLKLHWAPFHLLICAIREALEPFGIFEEVRRDTWRIP